MMSSTAIPVALVALERVAGIDMGRPCVSRGSDDPETPADIDPLQRDWPASARLGLRGLTLRRGGRARQAGC
jgi:hypothetical protein